jgi:hypothetical protein
VNCGKWGLQGMNLAPARQNGFVRGGYCQFFQLLHILNLFANSFQGRLDLDNVLRDFSVVGL